MFTRSAAVALAFAFVAGCGTPVLQTKRPKADPVKAADVASAIVDESGIVLSAPLDVAAVAAELEAGLPTTTGLDDAFVKGFRRDFRADRRSADSGTWERLAEATEETPARIARFRVSRGAVVVGGGPDGLWFEAPLEISGLVAELDARGSARTLRACGCGGASWCGREPSPPARARLRFTPVITEGPDGAPTLSLRPEVLVDERCTSGFSRGGGGVDVTESALAPMTLAATRAAVGGGRVLERVAGLEALVARVMASLSSEAPLAGGTLRLQPSGARVQGLVPSGAGGAVTLEVSLRPEWRGLEMAAPELALVDTTSRFRDAFEVATPLRIDATALSTPLFNALRGLNLSRVAHRRAVVEAVEVYGSAGLAVVAVEIAGSVPGTVYLTGDVHVDPALGTLSFERLDFTRASARAISQLYDHYQDRDLSLRREVWFDAEALRGRVADGARWGLSEALDALAAELRAAVAGLDVLGRGLALADVELVPVQRALDRAGLGLIVVARGRLDAAGGEGQ